MQPVKSSPDPTKALRPGSSPPCWPPSQTDRGGLSPGACGSGRTSLPGTESRLASFMTIGEADAEQRRWFQLSQPLTHAMWTKALLSWGGTMFESLMPVPLTRSHPRRLRHEPDPGDNGLATDPLPWRPAAPCRQTTAPSFACIPR